MKRLDFLKQMGESLFQTVHSVYEPFISGEIGKFESAADRALGIEWISSGLKAAPGHVFEMRYIKGSPIIMVGNQTNMRAFDGICPVCSHIIIVSALYSTVKCLNCEKTYNFEKGEGDFALSSFPVKSKDGSYYVSIPAGKRRGGPYA